MRLLTFPVPRQRAARVPRPPAAAPRFADFPSLQLPAAAAAWARAQPRRWPLVAAVLAWVVLVVAGEALSAYPVCSTEQPCPPDWADAVRDGIYMAVLMAAPVTLAISRRLGVVLSWAAAALWVVAELLVYDNMPVSVMAAAAAGVVVTTALLWWSRLRNQRQWERLTDDLPRAVWSGPPSGSWPGRAPLVWVAVLALLGVGLVGYGAIRGGQEAAAESRATRVAGTVVAHGDDGYLITVLVDDPERRFVIDTWSAADRPIGSRQELLLLPDGDARLVTEPYDASFPIFAGVLLVLLALALAHRQLQLRREVDALLRRPQPRMRVRLRPLDEGRASVLPAGSWGPPIATVPAPRELVDPFHGKPFGSDVQCLVHGLPIAGGVVGLVFDDGLQLPPTGRVGRP
jgi:hypothetical protein